MNADPVPRIAGEEDPLLSLAHDLRSRLTAVELFVSLVADGSAGPLNPEQFEYLGVAARNLAEVRCLTDGIFAFGPVSGGRG